MEVCGAWSCTGQEYLYIFIIQKLLRGSEEANVETLGCNGMTGCLRWAGLGRQGGGRGWGGGRGGEF